LLGNTAGIYVSEVHTRPSERVSGTDNNISTEFGNITKIGGNFMLTSPIEVQKALKDIDYPVHKKDLIKHAKSHKASDKVIKVLEDLPEREYTNAADVSKEFQGK